MYLDEVPQVLGSFTADSRAQSVREDTRENVSCRRRRRLEQVLASVRSWSSRRTRVTAGNESRIIASFKRHCMNQQALHRAFQEIQKNKSFAVPGFGIPESRFGRDWRSVYVYRCSREAHRHDVLRYSK